MCMTGSDLTDPGARTISLIFMRVKSEIMQWYCEKLRHTGSHSHRDWYHITPRHERAAVARPRRHQLPPLLKQVGAPIGALDRASDGVSQGLFGHLAWKARVLLRPSAES